MSLTAITAKPKTENAAAAAQLMAARKIVTAATPAIAIPNAVIVQDAKNPILIVKTVPDQIARVTTVIQKKKKRFITAEGAANLQ